MRYEVRLQPLAEKDLEEAYVWAAERAPATAAKWLRRFEESIQSLRQHPERCALAIESKRLGRELRQLNVGRKPHVFRTVFLIDGGIVRILRIRRATRRPLRQGELEE